MGEKPNEPLPLSFDASLKVDFQRSRITSHGGLVLVGELDERSRFGELIALHMTDSRRGKNMQLPRRIDHIRGRGTKDNGVICAALDFASEPFA